ncbi:MAG: phytoene/squalene synthase family protein, partial [Gemmataceae bacterium]|nr:phytoene/squalene synthase family protein [Gemmataceae bacterium]
MRSVADSYRWCERLARRAAKNFYPAFRLLPTAQRRAMCALYAFMRVTDDLADDGGSAEARRENLRGWRNDLRAALGGEHRHAVHPALADSVARHGIPVRHLEDVLDGVEMDLGPCRYATFADLWRYCYHVAGAVGLCCVRIWGWEGTDTRAAEAAGRAMQLTNILRDVAEDAGQGRVYLPAEDLERFGVPEAQLSRGPCDERFRALMAFQAARARREYEEAMPLARELPPPGRAVFLVMVRTYRALLERIAERGYDVFAGRVRVPGWRKLLLVASALPVR